MTGAVVERLRSCWRHLRGVLPLALLMLCEAATPPDPTPPADAGLTELRSSGGVLDVTLEAAPGKLKLDDIELDTTRYNGQYAGPVLHVRPGDLLRVRLVNHLSEPTNLHFHGLRTSPLGLSDNVHALVPPGGSLRYEVPIPPNQPPGVYWYHAHPHGLSERQVMGGLSGALVVDGPPVLPGAVERLFVLKEMTFDDDTGNARIDDELHGIVQTVNGRLDTNLAIRPGETQLWRFTNQSANRTIHIRLQGHRFRIVAQDGGVSVAGQVVDVLDILPAARVDVVVDGASPGRYALLSTGVMTGVDAARVRDRVLGHLLVAGDTATPAATMLPALPRDLAAMPVSARRTVVFTQDKSLDPAKQRFYLNGRIFDADRVDTRVALGSIEEWTVRNDTDDMHAFHIHQMAFQVVAINDAPVAFTGTVDTVRVPEHGSVTLRLAFTDKLIVGRFMYHCHVLKHEDKGMMAQIEVYDPRPPRLADRLWRFYLHVWWWTHGVAWSQCGLASA